MGAIVKQFQNSFFIFSRERGHKSFTLKPFFPKEFIAFYEKLIILIGKQHIPFRFIQLAFLLHYSRFFIQI